MFDRVTIRVSDRNAAQPLDEGLLDTLGAVATAAGHPSNGEPGERPEYHPAYEGAFVLDPDGNTIELVNHNR